MSLQSSGAVCRGNVELCLIVIAWNDFVFTLPLKVPQGEGKNSYPSSTASAPLTASAPSSTVFSSEVACTVMFSAKNRANVT
jgi:hypothetical protein